MLARGVYPPPSQFEAWFLSGAHTARDVEKTIKAAQGGHEEHGDLVAQPFRAAGAGQG